ncbi:MAG: PIN domain-containing protein [Gemmatimonadota bacterium]
MRLAYVDTSVLVAIAFGEPGAEQLARHLADFDERVSAALTEAEVRAAFAREEVPFAPALIASLSWILPRRLLSSEIDSVLDAGHLRGADLWHVACALYVSPVPAAVTFATLDARQRVVASALGFPLLPV